jgi:hypothetical protein
VKGRTAWIYLAAVGLYWTLQRLGKRGGATDSEVHANLPGDDVIPHPMVETTHAITIQAPAATIWKWLIQAGYRGSGRAGWYGDLWFSRPLEMDFLKITVPKEMLDQDVRKRSADEILPEYQHTAVGDIIPDGPPGTVFFIVKQVESERAWVLYSDSHIKYLSPTFLHNTPLQAQGEFSWVFVLNPIVAGSTRLILRTRANLDPSFYRMLLMPFIYLSEAIIPRLILRGIKQRSERTMEGKTRGSN